MDGRYVPTSFARAVLVVSARLAAKAAHGSVGGGVVAVGAGAADGRVRWIERGLVLLDVPTSPTGSGKAARVDTSLRASPGLTVWSVDRFKRPESSLAVMGEAKSGSAASGELLTTLVGPRDGVEAD